LIFLFSNYFENSLHYNKRYLDEILFYKCKFYVYLLEKFWKVVNTLCN
jgi:hypothetical protein